MKITKDHSVKLSNFVIDSELSRIVHEQLQDDSIKVSDRIVFDWSDVNFFDDYTLLKLIFLQRNLRSQGKRVSNQGFLSFHKSTNKQAVMRQLWKVGLPELIASGHLISSEQLKEALEDEAELLESDPLLGLQSPDMMTAVIPMLCCHNPKHFTAGSREEIHLDSFIRTCLRPPGPKSLTWDLVENREFRHLMLQQLRSNVKEHAHSESRVAIGLAIVRVWTCQSLSDEWGLTEAIKVQLLSVWNKEPVPLVLQKLSGDKGIIQISVIDDGIGIPCKLFHVHNGMLVEDTVQDLFHSQLRYSDEDFDKRFKEPASWTDENAKLIAFATDILGTSKPDRALEVKGLLYLKEDAVIKRGGKMCIESDRAAISHFTPNQHYGLPQPIQFMWCKTGGTGVSLAVPMSPVESSDDEHKLKLYGATLRVSTGSNTKRIRVRDILGSSLNTGKECRLNVNDYDSCAKKILDDIIMPEPEDDVTKLHQKGLLIVDWGELHDSKREFHYLLIKIAEGLEIADSMRMRPFVFVNLPKGLCCLVGTAIGKYSKMEGTNPTPVLAFTTEFIEPFWLGLNSINSIPDELRNKVSCKIQRKLTDNKENTTEAFYRACLTQLLTSKSLSGTSIQHSIPNDSRLVIQHYAVISRLTNLVNRCALFRESLKRSASGDILSTGYFHPVFDMGEIANEVRSLFLDKFREAFTQEPVCFIPKNKQEGILLPHSTRISARYFRSDALVDHPIATELSQELIAISVNFAKQMPNGSIDWVVTCTSPLHWFVHRIVDGLAEYGMSCSHYVFPSYEEIPTLIEDLCMRSDETVLVFTDVIASGNTAYRMADILSKHFRVKIAGLIALADIRTVNDRTNGPQLEKVYGDSIVCLYNDPEPNCEGVLQPTYYVHPETVVPKRATNRNPSEEFFERNSLGTGPIVEEHRYFRSAKHTFDLMAALKAVQFGHFQHGNHHSEIFVDVEKIFACKEYRNLLITALFRYIIDNNIKLVIYPSHSSAYILADELKQRFLHEETSVNFIMACRTFRGSRGTSYALTRFSPRPESEWKMYSKSAILILDDAICSGTTVKSIIAELARIDRNYYMSQQGEPYDAGKSQFVIHVVVFLNRLPRVTGDFWEGLSRVTAGRVRFSSFISMPLASDSEELCPQCRLEKKLKHVIDSTEYCHYAKEFLAWWISRNTLVSYHERRHLDIQYRERLTSKDAIRLAGYLSALERRAYLSVSDLLFDKVGHPAEEISLAVRIFVRSRAAFLYEQFPNAENAMDVIGELCKEIESLINLIIDEKGNITSQDSALEMLKTIVLRYLRMRPTKDEIERVMACLFRKYVVFFDDRLLMGGVLCVLDSCLAGYKKNSSQKEWKILRQSLSSTLAKTTSDILFKDCAKKAYNWLSVYLADNGEGISSVGKAVLTLASYAQKGRKYHVYGLSELEQLKDDLGVSLSSRPGDDELELVRRVLASCDRFNEMIISTRALQSLSATGETELNSVQDQSSTIIGQMRTNCMEILANTIKNIDTLEKVDNNMRNLFRTLYFIWFPEKGDIFPKRVINNFLPLLAETVKNATTTFQTSSKPETIFQVDYSSLDKHDKLKVIVDPEVLKVVVRHILNNIKCLPNAGRKTRVSWNVQEIEVKNQKINNGEIELIVSNTDTPRPNYHKLQLRGLSDMRGLLTEYGGELEVREPEHPWTFQVIIRLRRWAEV